MKPFPDGEPPTPSSRHRFVELKIVRLSECVVPLSILRRSVIP